MRMSDFDYVLPEELIAQHPLEDRAGSRLLVLGRRDGSVRHQTFRDVVNLFHPGDLLVMNDTRVTARRLLGRRPTGGQVEALVMKRRPDGLFEALVRPAKRMPEGSRVTFEGGLEALVRGDAGAGVKLLEFLGEDPEGELSRLGSVPLPPYIRASLDDPERYQTVYATTGGSAAAPTAGLHFTPELIGELEAKGVRLARVTLDVSMDTFRPVHAEDPKEHVMHGERCVLPEATAEAVRTCPGRVIAVGTTAVRTLETFAIGHRELESGERVSQLYITPGFEYRVVDGMLTNFHMPKTTMLLMLAALAGRDPLMEAYRQAVELRYRFLSFGDSMLIV